MLYAYLGEREKMLPKAQALERTLREKQPDAAYFVLDEETFSAERIDELSRGQGLFTQKYIVRVHDAFTSAESKKLFKESLPHIAESENIFILVEQMPDATTLKALEKHAEKIVRDKTQEGKKGRAFATEKGDFDTGEFNIFALADTFTARDKKNMWRLILEARARGIPDEEVHGILAWQARTVLLARGAQSAEEAGIKPFVYGKAKKALSAYPPEELIRAADDLLRMNHDARRGITDLGIALEHFALAL